MAKRDAATGGCRIVTKAHLPGQSILDVLRPPVGWKINRALLSSYSADPAVIAAALLALAARDDDGGSGTRAGLARALLELRGRVAFIVQRGRIAAPRRGGLVLGMLDRFVCEVPWNEGREDDEQGRSWHPKVAVLRYVPEAGGNARWRLWLGSRNLTRDTSWDVGLTVEGQAEGASQLLPGFPELVERLASAAGESQEWARHLPEAAALRWEVPRGLRLERVALHLPGDEGRSYPQEPAGLSELFAVSPFLDGTTVNHFGGWGDERSRKILLSTHEEFARLAGQQAQPLARFADLLALPAATFEPEQSNAEETVEENMEGRGLHAKFVWAEHAVGATLWLGSANLTRRGWTRNAEVVAEVAVERRGSARAAVSLIEGIRAFRDQCVTIRLADLPAAAEPDEVMERLEAARRTIAAHLDARQHVQADGGTLVVSPRPPHPGDSDIRLSVARLTGAAVTWAADATSARLPPVPENEISELLVFSVMLDDRNLSWLQITAFDPPLGSRRDDRDAACLASWLGARGLLAAVRDLLTGNSDGDGGGAWDAELAAGARRGRPAREVVLPTVEQALRAWIAEPRRLALVDRMMRLAVPPTSSDPAEQEAWQKLMAFRRSWKVIRSGLRIPTDAA
jgi:hypothetical protein